MKRYTLNYIRRGSYLDSVALMRLSKDLAGLPGVIEAAIMMGTPANLKIMAAADLIDGDLGKIDGGDMLFAVRAKSEAYAKAALESAKTLVETPKDGPSLERSWIPNTLRSITDKNPEANFVLISVPGDASKV